MTYPFPNFIGVTVQVWEWISNFIQHFTEHAISYPHWDSSESVLIKGAPGDAYMFLGTGSSLVYVMAYCLSGAKQ